MTGSVLVSYTRARAENVIPSCKVGFLERPERIVLIIIGALFNRIAPVLWVIAVLSNITVIHRVTYAWRSIRNLDNLSPTEDKDRSVDPSFEPQNSTQDPAVQNAPMKEELNSLI